nr:hypothetical protein BaRGS_006863 [Batillaria attramentaria]
MDDRLNITVSFSAYVTEGENLIAGRDKIVEFKGVLTNVGDAYDENSGLFTAPYAGVYFFILNVDVSTDHDGIRVRRNEKDVIFCADRDDESSTHLSGSASVILEEGDTISAHHCTGKGVVEGGSSINLPVAQSSIFSAIVNTPHDSRDHPAVDWSLNARLATSG